MSNLVNIAINGAAGRMGRQLLAAVAEHEQCQVSAAIEIPGHAAIGNPISLLCPDVSEKAGQLSVADDALLQRDYFDVAIDFTRPQATLKLIAALADTDKALVIGTTGFSAEELSQLHAAASRHAIVFAPNYSVGVTLTLDLLETAAASLGDEYDVEIIEAHHRNKVDAPSGTALRMGESVAKALNRDLGECAIYGREGDTGIRDSKTIGFETIRGGDIIGEHTVLFAGQGERVEITHRATDRMTFARGAARAAAWVQGQPPGLYDMRDVLGLSSN